MTTRTVDLRSSKPALPSPTNAAQRPEMAQSTQVRSVAALTPTTPVGDATTAALWLAQRHERHEDTTRRACMAAGCSQRRWERAIDALRRCGVVDRRGKWKVHTVDQVRAMLAVATSTIR